jgi:purine-binding chemotaxis protein CheW
MKQEKKAAAGPSRVVVFRIGDRRFGLEAAAVREIVPAVPATPIPRAQPYLKGVFSLRGAILPAIDLGVRLGMAGSGGRAGGRVLVVQTASGDAGLLVDSVQGLQLLRRASKRGRRDGSAGGSALTSGTPGIAGRFVRGFLRDEGGTAAIPEIDPDAATAVEAPAAPAVSGFGGTSTSMSPAAPRPPAVRPRVEPPAAAAARATGRPIPRLVTFRLGEEEYGLPIEVVREVLPAGRIVAIPENDPAVLGMMVVRGELIPVADARRMLALEPLGQEYVRRIEELAADLLTAAPTALPTVLRELAAWLQTLPAVQGETDWLMRNLRLLTRRLLEGPPALEEALAGLRGKLAELKESLPRELREERRVVVLRAEALSADGQEAGILVDRLRSVVQAADEEMQAPPALLAGRRSGSLKSIARLEGGRRVVLLLDAPSLFRDRLPPEPRQRKEGEVGGREKAEAGAVREEEWRFLFFRIGREEFCIDLSTVQEVTTAQAVRPVPRMPSFVKGILNLRGVMAPVLDLRDLFRMPAAGERSGPARHIAVVRLDSRPAGLLVDSVTRIAAVPKSRIAPSPAAVTAGVTAEFLKGVLSLPESGGVVLYLDVDKILGFEERGALDRMREAAGDRDGDVPPKPGTAEAAGGTDGDVPPKPGTAEAAAAEGER